MEQQKVDIFLMNKGDLFPAEKLMYIREMLLAMKDERWMLLSTMTFKNPSTALLISVGAGVLGAGRFYIGQSLLGTLKLILFLAFYFLLMISSFNDVVILTMFAIFLFVACLVWYLVDLFIISKTTKELNYNKLLLLTH